MNKQHIINLLLLCLTGIVLIALQFKPWGWLFLIAGSGHLYLCEKKFRRELLLVYFALFLLGITPITTDLSWGHFVWMGITLILAIAVPYLVTRYAYKSRAITFRWHHGRNWLKREVAWIFVTALLSYLILPFYLRDTGAYLNWSVFPNASHITRLFLGTNALGIWDELFFVSTVLGILRRHIPFFWANIVQAVLFTSFLYELGFTGWWGPIMIYLFALLQGYVFRKTDSLFYVITIHLTMDFILFLALINAHIPSMVSIFIT